ncbi:MAG: hypothetical protein H0V76_12520 [Blastocatellia bacterium]|nr:hypothetical protein [Blastocatellia bacterium]
MLAAGCRPTPVDPRSVLPADALVYLETRDLGEAIRAVTDDSSFHEAAATVPDLRAIDGIRLGIAVTGFETIEQPVTEENSILTFQPRFVAVAETGFYTFQVNSFVEERLGGFINETYGGGTVLETSEKHGGRYYTWTAEDGRKAYSLVLGSAIFFGNDETAIEKALAVRTGELPSMTSNPKVTSGDRLALGYVAADGIAQIATIAGVAMAKRSSEESEVQTFIARVLPELLRNSMRELTWTSVKTGGCVEDTYNIALNPEVAAIFAETLVPSGTREGAVAVPSSAESVTRYDLRDPRIAWRSVLLTAPKLTDRASGSILLAFGASTFEPYGIDDPEAFLSGIGPVIHTVKLDDAGERMLIIATVNDEAAIRKGLGEEFDFGKAPEVVGQARSWPSRDGSLLASINGSTLTVGDAEGARGMLNAARATTQKTCGGQFEASTAAAATQAQDTITAGFIADVLSTRKSENVRTYSLTETRFHRNGIDRTTTSNFGLIGTIISQFAAE